MSRLTGIDAARDSPDELSGACWYLVGQGTEPPIPIPISIPDLPGDGDGGPIPDLPGIGGSSPAPSPICRGWGVHPHPHPRFARIMIGDQAEYH